MSTVLPPPPVPPSPERRSVSYLNWRITSGLLWALAIIAVGCVVAEVAIWGLALASPSFTMPDWISTPFFAFSIIGIFIAVALVAATRGPKAVQRLGYVRQLPRWILGGLVVIAAAFFITGLSEFPSNLPGGPGYNPNTKQYYFNDHGQIIPTDRAHYLAGVVAQTRLFINGAIVLTCVIVLLSAAEIAWRRSVQVHSFSEIPPPSQPPPRLSLPAMAGVGLAAIGLVAGAVGFGRIVQRVDGYLTVAPAVTTAGTTENLSAGSWVVFTMCETHQTFAPYGCPQLRPRDIVIEDVTTGAMLGTSPDPSTDHISPDELPAAGQLTFSVPQSGPYSLRLTRSVPKVVFVDKSPGSVARSLIGTILVTLVGVGICLSGLVLWMRRVGWRFRDAPRVIVTGPNT
jgi:hypothetical protein